MSRAAKLASIGGLIAIATCAFGTPAASAKGTTLWVSTNTPSPPFDTCAHPGYDHIQEALGGQGTEIHVCAGTYAEQLTIERAITIAGFGAVTLTLPATPVNSTSPCDEASAEGSGLPDQDAISVCGEHTVTIQDLNVEAVWPGEPLEEAESCAFNLTGILVAGAADLRLDDSNITGARPHAIDGCQYGVGLQIGMSYTSSLGNATAQLSGDTIDGYNKQGIVVEGSGTRATIASTTVTGGGPQTALGQNGIGVQFGAKAAISHATVTANECENAACGPDALSQSQSDGVYFFEAGEDSSVSRSTIDENDAGVEAFDPTSAEPSITRDTLEGNRDESVLLSQGSAVISHDTMRDSHVGIELLQFEGQVYRIGGSAMHDTIEGMSEWALLGRSDDSPTDPNGEFTISKSKISGNPGSTPLGSIDSENPAHLGIFAVKDH